MSFSRIAASHLTPLLARILLCAVFVPIGWKNIMGTTTFTGESVEVVERMTGRSGTPNPDAGDAASPGEATDRTITARPVYGLADLLEKQGVSSPVVAAWATSIVELVGGTLLLVGLLSRIWALGLATIMGVAFALTSWPVVSTVGPFDLGLVDFHRAASQLALGVLAIGIVLGGAGAVSIDQGIFGRPRASRAAVGGGHHDEEDDLGGDE